MPTRGARERERKQKKKERKKKKGKKWLDDWACR